MYAEILNEKHLELVKTFDCKEEGLNNYIKEQAIIDQHEKKSTTTLLLNKRSGKALIGYFTLKNTSLLLKADIKSRGLPAIEIVCLAINKEYQRRGYGSEILRSIIFKAIQYSDNFSAIQAIILSSLESCVKFYKKNQFRDFNEFLEMLHDECRATTIPLFLALAVK